MFSFKRISILVALQCLLGSVLRSNWVIAQADTAYRFTSGVTNPAPIPGKPFTLTWTGGQADETVYIVLNYLFPDTPNQDIPYITKDILSNAPNNGSWTYNVPININQGRYYFSIGQNPFLLSDSTETFTILPSQTSALPSGSDVPPLSSSSNTAYQTYNGCGLPPLPDYTYTGYQPPCTTTVNGQVETLYPIVPASDSTAFFGTGFLASATAAASETASTGSTAAPSYNSAFASGVFAQALQCSSTVTPQTTSITASGTTTIFSTVACSTASASTGDASGVCHSSGYSTYSVSGTSSVCCPAGWNTTPLASELYCFTSIDQQVQRAAMFEAKIRAAFTEDTVADTTPLVTVSGVAFTRAGVVQHGVTATASTSGPTATTLAGAKSGAMTLDTSAWLMQAAIVAMGMCLSYVS